MLVKFIVSLLPMFIYIWLKTNKSFQMLQQNWYNEGNRYLNWVFKNYKKTFYHLDSLILLLVLFLHFINVNAIFMMIVIVLFYTGLSLKALYDKKQEQTKLELKVTARVKRLFITQFILHLLIALVCVSVFQEKHLLIYYIVLGALTYINYLMTYVTNIINKPIEKMNANKFKRRAMKKLKGMPDLSVVGITGSYGKTSSKNILNDILNVKYNSLPTPKNFNTPVGLIITINNHLDKFNDIFIAEMGAFKRGEIKELCDLVKPKYGILTKIGVAHLESFGSQENIQKGKFELIESLPQDGIGVLNGDDPLQVNYELKNQVKTVWIGIENEKVDVRATNIKLNSDGTTFDCIFKNDKKKYKFETKLLGRANVYNILAGIALGKELGIPIASLQVGVKKVKPIEHRLELKKLGILNIIDDAYNANPDGTKMALDVLNSMDGKKVVISSGMIELGDQSYDLNKELGTYMSDKVDRVMLIGKEQTKPIYDGLIEKKFNPKNIDVFNNVIDAIEMVKKEEKNTYVLIQSDLPDIFNEK